MTGESLKIDFIKKYNSIGEYKFYKFLLYYAINKLIKIKNSDYKEYSPELELLNNANSFLILYRRDNKDIYINISKIFRKAAHRIYRIMLRKKLTVRNMKFLNLV